MDGMGTIGTVAPELRILSASFTTGSQDGQAPGGLGDMGPKRD